MFPSRSLVGIALALAACTTMAREPAPGPDCMDARDVTQARHTDSGVLLAATSKGRYRIETSADCVSDARPSSIALLARDGWLCGMPNEFVRTDEVLCPVSDVSQIDAREYARLARRADLAARSEEGTPVLDSVDVTARRGKQRFAGSTDYCIASRNVRAWSVDAQGIIVHTTPMRSGGNRHYRVELAQSCPELSRGSHLALRSGQGVGMVCGNAGDVAIGWDESPLMAATRPRSPGGSRATEDEVAALQNNPALLALAPSSTIAIAGGCPIAAVYPIDI